MYGKIFSSLFTGSMVGAGAPAFALMSFVIANMKPDAKVGYQVELNVKLLAAILGEEEKIVQGAIDYLCSPDENTTTEGEDGRRLVKVGTFAYRVVNGVHYAEIRNEEDRREKNRIRQARFRQGKKLPKSHDKPASPRYKAAEARAVEALAAGDETKFEEIAEEGLPKNL